MAMSANQINIVPSYQTQDGRKFFTAEEAQTHTRNSLYGVIFDRAVAKNLDYARLDKTLLIDFLMMSGGSIAIVARDPLEPRDPNAQPAASVQSIRPLEDRKIDPQAAARAFAERSVDTLKTAMANVTEAERAEAAREKFGAHPLDPKTEADLEADVAAAIEAGRKSAGLL